VAVGDQFHLAWFLGNSFGVHAWKGQWAGAGAREWAKPDFHIDMARALERAGFDYLLMEDSSFVPDDYGSSMDFYLRNAMRVPKNDPVPLVPLIAQATRHLGIVATISTSFYPPFLAARLFATLDLLSEGRVGINLVTSTSSRAAQNFGLDEHIEHDTRYAMADEFAQVMRALWNSWDEDAVVADVERGVFVEPGKVRTVDFRGRFFSSRGPLNTPRPPQGHPVLTQAGTSPPGRALGARHADSVLASFDTVEGMKEFRADMRARLKDEGRDPDSCKILFVVTPTLGDTGEEARGRLARRRAASLAAPEGALAGMASLTGIDFSTLDLDMPIEELTTNGQQGTFKRFLSRGSTLREIVATYRYGYEDLVGTPDEVAGQLEDVMAEVGGDGVMFSSSGPLHRRYLAEITDGLVPALQRRGLTRTEYAHDTFRDNLLDF
jgi:FMN-dependent oxidoreductase (nitrilotriacetate monooxygenase family)